jgi:hypothetical protein
VHTGGDQDDEHGKLLCPHVGSSELLMEMKELAARGSEDGEGRKLGVRSLRQNETVRLRVRVQRDNAMARRRTSRSGKMTRQDGTRPGPERHATARRRTSRSGETCDGKTARVQVRQGGARPGTGASRIQRQDPGAHPGTGASRLSGYLAPRASLLLGGY